jgi:hypothetical protein
MSQLQRIEMSYEQAATDLEQFKSYLGANESFSEGDVVGKLKGFPHLCCLLGSLIAGVPKANVFKFEFQIQGVFAADLVVGNTQRQRYVFIEFEDGSENGLFGKARTAQMRNWSTRFEHGFGQLVDWEWALNDGKTSAVLQNNLGGGTFAAEYLLVCGRDHFMEGTEKERLFYRAQKVLLDGKPATCMTYDGLLLYFDATIEAIRSYSQPPIGGS